MTATARHGTPELEAIGATVVPADLATADGPQRLVDVVLAADRRLDVLVNNAGGGVMPKEAFGDPLDGGDDVWAGAFALNLDAAVRTTRAALPALVTTGGAVVNISSDSARRPGAGPLPYSAAKAALTAFTRGLAERVAASGVRVNAVSPSSTHTELVTGKDGYVAQVAAGLGCAIDTAQPDPPLSSHARSISRPAAAYPAARAPNPPRSGMTDTLVPDATPVSPHPVRSGPIQPRLSWTFVVLTSLAVAGWFGGQYIDGLAAVAARTPDLVTTASHFDTLARPIRSLFIVHIITAAVALWACQAKLDLAHFS